MNPNLKYFFNGGGGVGARVSEICLKNPNLKKKNFLAGRGWGGGGGGARVSDFFQRIQI